MTPPNSPLGGSVTAANNTDDTLGPVQSRQQPGSACNECRRRKLRCDRSRPKCSVCNNIGIDCIMRNSGPPRGPKKGHLRALRSQIEALQTRLNEKQNQREKESDNEPEENPQTTKDHDRDATNTTFNDLPQSSFSSDLLALDFTENHEWFKPLSPAPQLLGYPDLGGLQHNNLDYDYLSSRKSSIGLLLTPVVSNDLDQLYFDRAHIFAPMIHKFRYLGWSRQPNKTQEKTCLQYAMWSLAASLSSQFHFIRDGLYTEARKLLDDLDAERQEVGPISLHQVQAWILLSIYEFASINCQRAQVSVGRAFRLIQIMKLHEMDKPSLSFGQGDWIELESARRTFWIAFIIDRFTSAYDKLPLTFNEQQIGTRLPVSDANFMTANPTNTSPFLSDVLADLSNSLLNNVAADPATSAFSELIIISTICGRALTQIQAHATDNTNAVTDQEFSRRQQFLNAVLSARMTKVWASITNTPEHPDPVLIFVTLSAYMVGFMLCEAGESASSATQSQAFFKDCQKRAVDVAMGLGVLLPKLAQLNYFQMQPLIPIPLSICAKFCISRKTASDNETSLVHGIVAQLQSLAGVNSLAKTCLYQLNLNAKD